MKTFHRVHRKSQRGQAIVIVALSMIGLLSFLVLAIDGSKYLDQRRVTQNAADVSALAGLYTYYDVAAGNNNKAVIAKIIHTAEVNGIPDTDGTLSNGLMTGNVTNDNVEAYWVNLSGDYVKSTSISGCTAGSVSRKEEPPLCAKITTDATFGMPSGSTTAANNGAGIRVRIRLPYTTFIGQMIGQKNLRAQADGIALHTSVPKTYPPSETEHQVWAGGGAACNDGSNPALSVGTGGHGSANNTDIGAGMVNGGLVGGETNQVNNQYPGTITVTGGTNGTGGTSNPLNLDSNTSNQYLQGSQYAPANQFNEWAYYTDSQQAGVDHILKQAVLFKPDNRSSSVDVPTSPAGAASVPVANDATLPNNYIFRNWYNHLGDADADTKSPANFYHYISYSSSSNNYLGLKNMIDAGKRGIFYVDGDLVLPSTDTTVASRPAKSWSSYSSEATYGVTVITSGHIIIDGPNNKDFGNAGAWGHGITFLAGGYPDTGAGESPCALDKDDAIFFINANQNDWKGIVFVPNGLAAIGGNFNNSGITHGVLMAYSIGIGMDGHPSNNAAFGPCSECFIEPATTITNLNQ